VRLGDHEYLTGVVPVPGGRNSTPNPAYDGGRGYEPVGAVGMPQTGLRCEGNASCIPACPAQAKYSALKTLAAAEALGVEVRHQAVASRVLVDHGRVTGIQYLRWQGSAFPQHTEETVTAKVYVLAAHSVENAKLLLHSEVANSSGQVGRNLMDHPFLLSWALADEPLGTFRGPGSSSGIETLRDGPYRARHSSFRVDIDNWGFGLLGSPMTDVTEAVFDDGLFGEALRERLESVQRQLMIGFLLEQLPNPNNRVELATGYTDALGLPRPAIHYDFDDWTKAGAAVARECAKAWFEEVGAEDLTTYDGVPVLHQPFTWNGESYSTLGAGHLCGTHRMGSGPADSVVDSFQRSWDHPNLFVVGAGSMCTIGTSNPTLTLAALACRSVPAILEDL
jgi:choline dehydrogenase-like flavoprotein